MNMLQDRVRGSLIGGAIGDALGYPVEFNSYTEIVRRYGERGITRLETEQSWLSEDMQAGKAVVSDDTQMTLFTANGLLNAPRLGIEPKFAICRAYLEWLETQTGQHKGKAECWIRDAPELNCRRAPGNTCISSLSDIKRGRDPMNNSKGCGGVMRVAPIPLYAVVNDRMTIADAEKLAGDAAEITHQHPLGFISAALMSHVIFRLAKDIQPTVSSMMKYIMEAPCGYWRTLSRYYGRSLRHWGLMFLVYFVSMLIVMLASMMVMMPANILSLANQQAHGGLLIGDPLGMPSYIMPLTFVTCMLCSFIDFYINQVTLVHNYYLYGSIETKEGGYMRNE